MTRVSRRPLNQKEKSDLIEEFWHALGYLNKAQVKHFLKEFFSPTETLMFAKRLDILKGLRKEVQYEHIQQALKVSEPTVAKMSSALQRGDENFVEILDDVIKYEAERWQAYLDSKKPRMRGRMIFYTPK